MKYPAAALILGVCVLASAQSARVDPFAPQFDDMVQKESAWRQAHREFVATMDSLDTCDPGYRASVRRLQEMTRLAFEAKRAYHGSWRDMLSRRVSSYGELERAVPLETARLRQDRVKAQRDLADAIRRRAVLVAQSDAAIALDALITALKSEIEGLEGLIDRLDLNRRDERAFSERDLKDLELLDKRLAESAKKQLHSWDNLYETFISRGRIRCPNFQ